MDVSNLRRFCLEKVGVTEDMPFDESVLALRVGGKIFALTNINNEEFSVNLKAHPDLIVQWREEYPDIVLPGYHMSKKHWNTVYPNRGLKPDQFFEMVNTSYEAVFRTLPKWKQKELSAIR